MKHDIQIVSLQHRKVITTSLKVAEAFGKSHKSVLRAIDNINSECEECFNRRNFTLIDYQDSKGRTQPMMTMTRTGFTLIAMGFTGKAATAWKIKYIDAFDKMEAALIQKHNLEWQQSRTESKDVRRNVTDTIQAFIQYAINQGSSHAQKYYVNLSRMTRKAIGEEQARDMLDLKHLSFLATAEYMIQQIIEEGMTAGLHYKDIYKIVKNRVIAFSKTLSCQSRISD
ncbi:MAG: Rha family transcriptional regulator [Desulfuromonadaceae bacterium]